MNEVPLHEVLLLRRADANSERAFYFRAPGEDVDGTRHAHRFLAASLKAVAVWPAGYHAVPEIDGGTRCPVLIEPVVTQPERMNEGWRILRWGARRTDTYRVDSAVPEATARARYQGYATRLRQGVVALFNPDGERVAMESVAVR